MFIEPHYKNAQERLNRTTGWIEVICGSMFSGKTEELIRRLNRAIIAKEPVEIFKPSVDIRYHEKDVVSHNNNAVKATPVNFASEILLLAEKPTTIGIDEAQFFDENIVEVCMQLAKKGKRVILAGLDMDSEGKPFGPMPNLLAIAEYITKVHAICTDCGGIAQFSYRLSDEQKQVMLGDNQDYQALCRACFNLKRSSE